MNGAAKSNGLAELGAARAAQDGIAHEHEEYVDVNQSISKILRIVREARLDKDVTGYAVDVLKSAGVDGRDGIDHKRMAQAILDNVRASTIYVPDAHNAERIVSPAGMLCLRPGLCIRGGDCDDLLTLFVALCLAVGVPALIVKHYYGEGQQQHVLAAIQDNNGQWLYADPSVKTAPVGANFRFVSEERYDPMDVAGSLGEGVDGEIVTLGKPNTMTPHHAGMLPHARFVDGAWQHVGRRFENGKWWEWWPGQGWLVVAGVPTCSSWGSALAHPDDALAAEARVRLMESSGAPVTEVVGGVLYLFTRQGIYPCAGQATYLGAPPTGLGFCDYDLIKSVRARLVAPWYALNGDVDACAAFPTDQRYAFKGDFDSFVNWYSGALPNDIFCKDAERDEIEQGRDYESRLNNWRKILSATQCQLSSPDLPPLTDDDPRSRDYKPPNSDTADTLDKVKDLLITVGVIGGVAVGVYLTMPLIRAGVESLAKRSRA